MIHHGSWCVAWIEGEHCGEHGSGPDADSDDALLDAIRRRDEEAIAALYDRYGRLAFGLAYRVVGERNAAEDVVQEAFLSIWRRAGSFETTRGSVRTWVLSIVHHRAIDRLRGTAGRTRQDAPIDDFERVLAIDDPWREVSQVIQRESLQKAIATLPDAQRQAVELAYFDGYTQQEIATRMEVPVGTVKGRLRLAMQRLRSLLAGIEDDQG
ncbi:MAG: sigma-70 family RNA polymerase sigma factor [Chloroflexia bacterium]